MTTCLVVRHAAFPEVVDKKRGPKNGVGVKIYLARLSGKMIIKVSGSRVKSINNISLIVVFYDIYFEAVYKWLQEEQYLFPAECL